VESIVLDFQTELVADKTAVDGTACAVELAVQYSFGSARGILVMKPAPESWFFILVRGLPLIELILEPRTDLLFGFFCRNVSVSLEGFAKLCLAMSQSGQSYDG